MGKPNLEDVMESIVYQDANSFNERTLLKKIKDRMPGYVIQVWDLDQYVSSELFGSAMEEICFTVNNEKKVLLDVQYVEEWWTNENDACFCVLAYKTKN